MTSRSSSHGLRPWQAFLGVFAATLALAAWSSASPAPAQAQNQAQTPEPTPAASTRYNGPDFCGSCHTDIHQAWETTRHAAAFSSPVFQQDWQDLGSQFACLSCHTTRYDAPRHR